MPHEEEIRQLNELYDLGKVWIDALETENREEDAKMKSLMQVEEAFLKARAQIEELSRFMNNGRENAR